VEGQDQLNTKTKKSRFQLRKTKQNTTLKKKKTATPNIKTKTGQKNLIRGGPMLNQKGAKKGKKNQPSRMWGKGDRLSNHRDRTVSSPRLDGHLKQPGKKLKNLRHKSLEQDHNHNNGRGQKS